MSDLSKKIQPGGADILVTTKLDKTETISGLIIPESAKSDIISGTQVIVAKGPHVTQYNVGDTVKIKMNELLVADRQAVKGKTSSDNDITHKTRIILDPNKFYSIDGEQYLLIREGNIAFKELKDGEEPIEAVSQNTLNAIKALSYIDTDEAKDKLSKYLNKL